MNAEIPSKPTFDHCYRNIENDDTYRALSDRGFCLNPTPVRHPGRLKCQFLHFLSPEGVLVYLEFIFRDLSLPIENGKPEEAIKHAGYSLKVASNLEKFAEQSQKTLAVFGPSFKHRNYDWQADEKAKLPGWNFLTFEKPPVDDIYVWLIEYEPRPDWTEEFRTARREFNLGLCQHPNSARRILGFLWNDSVSVSRKNMADICRADISGRNLILEGGTQILGLNPNDSAFDAFKSKASSFLAVLIGVESLDTFIEKGKPDDIFDFFGRRAARIRFDDNSWDIVAVQDKSL